jgi:hypothetical protein
VLFFSIAFPEGGRFPFNVGAFITVLVVGGLAVVYWRQPPVAVGGVLYGVLAVAVFVIPTPLGANICRLGQAAAAPLLICAPRRPGRVITAALLGALLWWQWSPAFDAMFRAGKDPSAVASYYKPLLGFLHSRPGGPLRIEVPVTVHHWEVVYLAPSVGLARGWERQLDIAENELFYVPHLDPASYLSWLDANAISYVALPDAALDSSARQEAALLRAGAPSLSMVWSSAHWTVWQVRGSEPLVSGPATLVSLDADSFTLLASAPGDIEVRVHYTSHWEAKQSTACVGPSSDGEHWTLVRVTAPGRVRVGTTLARTLFSPSHHPVGCEVAGA